MNQPMTLESTAFARRIPVSQMRARALQGRVGRAASQTLGRVLFYAEDNGEGALVAHVTDGLIADDLGISRKTVTRHRAKLASKLSWVEVTCDHTGALWVIQTTEQRARTGLGQGGDTSGSSEGHCGDTTEQKGRTELGQGGDPAGTPKATTPISQEHPHTSPLRGECVGVQTHALTDLTLAELLVKVVKDVAGHDLNVWEAEAIVPALIDLEDAERLPYLTETAKKWAEGRRDKGWSERSLSKMLRVGVGQWRADEERDRQVRQRGAVTQPPAPAPTPEDRPLPDPEEQKRLLALAMAQAQGRY